MHGKIIYPYMEYFYANMSCMHNYQLRKLIARRMRELMAASEDLYSQTALANKTGVAQTTISRILKEQVSATLDNVEGIAKAFGISAAELLARQASSSDVDAWLPEIKKLSDEDRERVFQFIKFTIEQKKFKPSEKSFNLIDKSEAPPPNEAEMAEKAAGRDLTNNKRKTTLTYESRQTKLEKKGGTTTQ